MVVPAVLDLVSDTLLPPGDSAWRSAVASRALERLRAQPELRDQLARLRMFLRLLDSPLGCWMVGGKRRAFSALSRAEREQVMQRMCMHPVGTIRGAALSLKRLAGAIYFGDADATGANPNWAALNYPGPLAPSPAADKPIAPLRLEGIRELECDVVVVGSGAGGGIVAAELAEAGHDVLVLERGPYLAEPDFNQLEVDTFARAYLDGGLRTTQDLGTLILAGACLGGGTVVNYTTSFRTPDDVRAEWARVTGFNLFCSNEFSAALDAACERLGVNQHHNSPSTRDALMEQGLTARGWHVDRMPRDVIGCTQDEVCGYCGLGCVRGAKRSTVKSCLESAAAHGARIAVGVNVQRVLVEGGRATGVLATQNGHALRVRARRTVVAGGAIGSPALLLRSGVQGPVGQYLRLHPATAVWGVFDEPVRPWTGTIQALYSNHLADIEDGYGVRFETAPVHPSFMGMATPWPGASDYGRLVRRLPNVSLVGVLDRDRDHGRVLVGRTGQVIVRYRPSRYDQRHIRQGVLAAGEVLAAAGAREVYATQNRYVPWLPASESLANWTHRLDKVGYGSNHLLYVSFHQMGSCRMGSDPRTSVVGADGQCHTLKNLHVADASLFPSASGVNPMVTIAALAYHVAQCLKSQLP
jgi:choline dehydrogenase-like flavoprotein